MKEYRVNTMQGADGRLRTSYFQGDAARVAGKHVKAFNKELKRYDKVFSDYASYQENDDVYNQNSRYIFGKLGIAEKYVEHISEEDMIDGVGIETAAVAGSKHASKMGIKAKIAKFFQPAFEKQAQKHPALQGLSDRVSKAANNGRLPLTADSAAMMKIAFDKRYYREIREPGANVEEIREKYENAVGNLRNLAQRDGVSPKALSRKLDEKLAEQIQVDETLTDVYKGMSTGAIRFAPDEPVLNRNGEPLKVRGKVLYKTSQSFVDKEGNALDPFDFQPREPQSIDEIVAEYKEQLSAMTKNCRTEAGFKKALESPTYKNLFRNANEFASSDCPDEADKFRYEMRRAGLMCCKEWALKNDITHPYANIKIPEPYDDVMVGSDFNKKYATADYYEEDLDIEQEAYEETVTKSADELAADLRQDVSNAATELNDIDRSQDRVLALETRYEEYTGVVDDIKDEEYNDEIGDKSMTDDSPVIDDYIVNQDYKNIPRQVFEAFKQKAANSELCKKAEPYLGKAVMAANYVGAAKTAYDMYKESKQEKPDVQKQPDPYAEAYANSAGIGDISSVNRALIEQMKEATPGIDLNEYDDPDLLEQLKVEEREAAEEAADERKKQAGHDNKMTPEEWEDYFEQLDAEENEVSENEVGVDVNFDELDVDAEEQHNGDYSAKIAVSFVDPAGDTHYYASDKAVDLTELMQVDKNDLYKYCKDNDDLKAIDNAQMAELEQNSSDITVVSFDTDLEAYLQEENAEPVVANIRIVDADGKCRDISVTEKMISSAADAVFEPENMSVEEINETFIDRIGQYAPSKEETVESQKVSSDRQNIVDVMNERVSEFGDQQVSTNEPNKDDEPKF